MTNAIVFYEIDEIIFCFNSFVREIYKIFGHVWLTFLWDKLVEQSVDNVSSNTITSESFTLFLPLFKARILSIIPFLCLKNALQFIEVGKNYLKEKKFLDRFWEFYHFIIIKMLIGNCILSCFFSPWLWAIWNPSLK